MNSPIRDISHQRRIADGAAEVIGFDHAAAQVRGKGGPLSREASVLPGAQTLLRVILTLVAEGRLTLARFVNLTSHGPQFIFHIGVNCRIAEG